MIFNEKVDVLIKTNLINNKKNRGEGIIKNNISKNCLFACLENICSTEWKNIKKFIRIERNDN